MRRYIAIYLPQFSIQRQRRIHMLESPTPLALTHTVTNQVRIIRCCSRARKTGIHEDMSLSLARALCPALQTYQYEPLQDFKLLYKVGVSLLSLTPFVALDSTLIRAYKTNSLIHSGAQEYGIILDTTGTERLYRSEQNLLRKIFSLFETTGFAVTIGVCSTIGAAWALSRYGHCASARTKQFQVQKHTAYITAPTKQALAESLAPLPVSALRISTDTTSRLAELGLYTIESLKDYSSRELALRFGTQLVSRLDQARGNAEETLHLLHPTEHITTDLEFDPPLQVKKAVEQSLLQAIDTVQDKLVKAGKCSSKFILTLQGINPHKPVLEAPFCLRKQFTLHSGTDSTAHIASIISPFFEQLSVPEGVTRLTLAAQTVQKARSEQKGCFASEETTASEAVQSELLNMLVQQLGQANVRVVDLRSSYIPERSYAFVPLDQKTRSVQPQHRLLRYPPTIFQVPEKISAISLLPDAPPTRITWGSSPFKILQGFGPERITSEWWQQAVKDIPEEREYFRVQDETGRWLWLFRNRSSMEWFVHGMWV